MNWMDDGVNNNSAKPIEFEAINVEHNISLAEAIKLSVEKSGYEAEIIKKDDATSVNIKIPFLVEAEDDVINLDISMEWYSVLMYIGIRRINTLEEKLAILEYINYNNGCVSDFIEFSWLSTDELSLIALSRWSRRLDRFDKMIQYGLINADIVSDALSNNDNKKELLHEKFVLKDKIKVYIKDDLEFNMSGKWNATHGGEYISILKDINHLISVVQREKENLLRFI